MIELHRKLLGDHVRNAAFHEALKRVIRKGETTIADVGAGTGFLSFLAIRLGARHCTLIEYSEILDTAKKLAKRNKIDRCTFIRKHSFDVVHGPKVDVVLSETLGNYALEENIIETIQDAKRFLKPKGIIIPGKIRQCVCPVISDRLMKDIDIWSNVGFDLDFTEAREVCLHNMYVKTFLNSDLLHAKDAIREWDVIDFHPMHQQRGLPGRGTEKRISSIRSATLLWKDTATVYGFALWWEAELVPGITLSTSPFAPPTHWEQIFLPLPMPVHLKEGERIELTLVSDTRLRVKINLTWTVRHLSTSGRVLSEQRMDMKRGNVT